MEQTWLDWARRLQAIAQSGLAYSPNQYDLDRYEAVREIAAEMMAAGSASSVAPIRDLFAGQTGYATPKVDMRAAVFRENRILLVQESEDGAWSLPGGWADVGESPAEATVREVREEPGYETRGETAGRVRPQSPRPPAHPVPRLQALLPVRADRRRAGAEQRNHWRRLVRRRQAAAPVNHARHGRADPPLLRALPESKVAHGFRLSKPVARASTRCCGLQLTAWTASRTA